jgi:hypothetical protein
MGKNNKATNNVAKVEKSILEVKENEMICIDNISNKDIAIAVANIKSNEMLFDDMLKNFDKSLLKTSKGLSNDVYKKTLFIDCSPSEIKTLRRKLRNEFINICFSINRETNLIKLSQLIAYFIKFSRDTYELFDFNNLQVSHFCSANMSESNKDSIKNAIDVINKQVEKLSKQKNN